MKYSIITINYNNRIGLERTIQSVLCQTYDNYEYIVIDGASTDGSVEIIKKYESKLAYWVSEKDNGIYHAMNKGICHSLGDYCVFMNSGDVFYSDDVLAQVANLGYEEKIIVGNVVSGDGVVIPTRPSRDFSLYHLYSASIPHQASFICTELLKKYPYDENLKIVSDWKFFLQTLILDNCTLRYIDTIIAEYDLTGISSLNSDIMLSEKRMVLSSLILPRILSDYQWMKSTECKTQTLTPQLKDCYRIDKILYYIGRFLLWFKKSKY